VLDKAGLIVRWLLCGLVLVFPFSVAASNALLGTVLGLGMLCGMWRDGILRMWADYRSLSLAMLAYWGLMAIGLLWSSDRAWGLQVLGHQWFWLAVPVLVVALNDALWRTRLLMLLSLSLTAHLVFCVLQMFGYVSIADFGGSNAEDATGYIGHIGFGFVYGIWAGWLLHRGWYLHGLQRAAVWLLASWAWVMIFAAQGRSGYLVAVAMLAIVLWRQLVRVGWSGVGWKAWGLPLGLLVVMGGLLATGPGKERMLVTLHEVSAMWSGEVGHANPRWTMWIISVEAWLEHPVLGVGTGGFPQAAAGILDKQPLLKSGALAGHIPSHPHNMYMLSLARWGLVGLAAFMVLVVLWMRSGWRLVWGEGLESPLLVLSGLALAIDACFAPTIEQHGTGVLLVLMLALGLASGKPLKPTGA